jgi:predicted extracellular nuclease
VTRRLLPAFLLASLLLLAPTAQGASADLVISQVYAGGGNAGATYTNDFVEVFNRGSSTVDLTGWTIQYATATGTSWSPTALAGSLAPGRHYLVQLASAGAVGAPLPSPDATGTTNFANAGGKVAIVHDTAAVACGATAGSCSAVAAVHDLVGYGSAIDYEGAAPADALDNASAAVRAGNGCTDTDSSAADFTTAAPAPRTTTAAAISCSGATGSGSQGAVVDIDVQSTLSISLEHATLSFGSAVVGQTPVPVGEKVTVTSTDAQGYTLMAHRSAFTPADLPLGVGSTAPAGGLVNALFGGGALLVLPVGAAAELLVGTTTAASVAGGDVWPTRLGFTSALPAVPPGHYSSTVTYTVIAR